MNEKILSILQEVRPDVDFANSSNFVEDGLLDSFDMITLVAAIDAHFLVSIDGESIIPENFSSIDQISDLLRTKGIS